MAYPTFNYYPPDWVQKMSYGYGTPKPKAPYPELFETLGKAIPFLNEEGDKTFALSLYDGHIKHGGWTDKQALWAGKMAAKAGFTSEVQIGTAGAKAVMLPDKGAVFSLPDDPPMGSEYLGKMEKVTEMLAEAQKHLQHPAITLQVKYDGKPISVSSHEIKSVVSEIKIKPLLKDVGSLKVVSTGPENHYYGKITAHGWWVPSKKLIPVANHAFIETLKAFLDDPVKVAGEFGHLSGKCCFCYKPLTDPQSTAVGYGPVCATHWKMPWGNKPVILTTPKNITVKVGEHKDIFEKLFKPGNKPVILKEVATLLHGSDSPPQGLTDIEWQQVTEEAVFKLLTQPVEYLF